ncbi:hypothetical protein [Bacillus horti]|uniref:DUF4129 domain-containing protein n=1 Tax=Caldalkalibacillus horti TaxID=77523 RepID=A0ABT9W4U5_9BACI|nr:hypothetical protein [Bacillus horti]MDQ0168256.1 hypothetical protein [Bacillus horti]
MLKRIFTAMLYYVQEVLTFFLGFYLLLTSVKEQLSIVSFYSWAGVCFIIGVPFLLSVKAKAPNSRALALVLPVILCVIGFLLWDINLAVLIIITAFFCWRLLNILPLKLEAEHVLKRLTVFVGVLVISFIYVSLMTIDVEQSLLLTHLWIQFIVMVAGLLYRSYLKNQQEMGSTIWEWLKSQTLLLYLGLGFGALALATSFLLPAVQFILRKIPEGLSWLFTSPPIQAFFSWLLPNSRWQPSREEELELEETIYEIGEGEEVVEEVVRNWFDFVVLGVGILFFALILVCLILFIILLVRKGKGFMSKQEGRTSGDRRKVHEQAKSPRMLSRKVNWVEDDIRKQYQSLLVQAERKGEPVSPIQTVRSWSKEFKVNEQAKELWNNVNAIYEQQRYSNQPVEEKQMDEYKQEIKKAKKELDLFYKEKKKQEKQLKKMKKDRSN